MESDQPASSPPSRRIALLIDADNVSHAKVAAILAELAKYGTANIRRAYGDWGSAGLKGWKSKLQSLRYGLFNNSAIPWARMQLISRW